MPSDQRIRVLSAIGLTVLPLVAFGAFAVWQQLGEEEQSIANDRVQLARAAAFATESFIEGHLSTARSIARHPSLVAPRNSPGLAEFLKSVALANPEWEGLGVVGPDGYSVFGAIGSDRVFIGDRPYFKEAVGSGRPVVSPAVIGRLSGKTTVVLAVPFDVASGGRGVLAVPLPTDRFGASLRARVGTPEVIVTVVDSISQVLIGPDLKGVRELLRLSGPEIDAVLGGAAGSMRVLRGGQETLVAYAPVAPYRFGVLLSQDVAEAFAPARRQALERAAILVAILAAVLGLGWFLGGWLAAAYEREARARAQAEQLSRELQRSLETRDEFLASASHDLRNPLGAIQAAGETLARSLERTGAVPLERLNACIQHVQRSSRRMANLLDGFMDIAQLQLGRPLELNRKRLDLVALLRDVVAECQQTTTQHRLQLDAPAEVILEADGPRLQRALSNLLGNAIKYSPDGGDVRITVRAETGAIGVSIVDRGIGIPAADIERVFRRFERGSNAVGRFPGTGIGLSGAQQIVEQHGGSIVAGSVPGAGTTITLVLPIESTPA